MKNRASPETDSSAPLSYRGRFAPSPNGPLHFGSLIAATVSYLDACAHDGEWWLRIDDIDTPRVVPGATDAILATLERYGFQWNGLTLQSQRLEIYADHFDRLKQAGWLYPCVCSRKQVFARHPQGIYAGHCRMHPPQRFPKPPAWRMRQTQAHDAFTDLFQGEQRCDCARTVGEFIIRRADDIWGYHFVCAVDEMEMGITHVIRGADLLHSTFAQRQVLRALQAPPPRYGHHPIVTTTQGVKLSKRAGSRALPMERPAPVLACALRHIGLPLPPSMARASIPTLWQWAKAHYNRRLIPQCQAVPAHDCVPG